MLNTGIEQRHVGLSDTYDLVIVGGGIQGAAMLWEAVSRGISAILIEKGDFGGGTSSNSLKTIHGGIRYLQDFDIGRLRESVRERRALMKIAPHLIGPMQCLMPTYREFRKSRYALTAGMMIYDLLACDRNRGLDSEHQLKAGKVFSFAELKNRLPVLEDQDVTGGAQWFDAQVYNSERLVLCFINSAIGIGGRACNYMEFMEYLIDGDHIRGIRGRDSITGKEVNIRGEVVIDCRGPWAVGDRLYRDHVLNDDKPHLARAVNLVVSRPLADFAVGVKTKAPGNAEAPGRLMFIAPWRTGSIIGTWYFPDSHSPDSIAVSDEELDLCIDEFNSVFPTFALSHEDITLFHVGMLPMEAVDHNSGEPVLQNKFRIIHAAERHGPRGLVWVQGVKYTTARHVAEVTIDTLSDRNILAAGKSRTDRTPLAGGDIRDTGCFMDECIKRYKCYVTEQTVKRMVRNYGRIIEDIMRLIDADISLGSLIPGTTDCIKAELDYILNNEMCFTLSDLLLRRTDIGSLALPSVATIEYCAGRMAHYRDWGSKEARENIEELLRHYPEWTTVGHDRLIRVSSVN